MKLYPPDEKIELYTDGFAEEDPLQRKPMGQALTDLLSKIEDPLVVALNGSWGSGKTYFLKRWVGQDYGVAMTRVYFDAFEHDYLGNPLQALIGSLIERGSSNDQKLAKVKEVSWKMLKSGGRIAAAVGTSGISEVVGPIVGTLAAQTMTEAQETAASFWKKEADKKTLLKEFKTALAELVRKDTKTPVVFVIDELDRCRPDYALEVLEIIKHVFDVPHVHFVLGVNLKSLQSSVHAAYGAELDAEQYLRKFIDVKLQLPRQVGTHRDHLATTEYLKTLINEMEFPAHLSDDLTEVVKVVDDTHPLSLRDIRQIMSAIASSNQSMLNNVDLWPLKLVYLHLIVMSVVQPELMDQHLNQPITRETLAIYLGVDADKVDTERYDPQFPQSEDFRYLYYHLLCAILKQPHGATESFFRQQELSSLLGRVFQSPSKIFFSNFYRNYIDRFQFYGDRG